MFAIRLLRLQHGQLPKLPKNDSQPDAQFRHNVSSETELRPTRTVIAKPETEIIMSRTTMSTPGLFSLTVTTYGFLRLAVGSRLILNVLAASGVNSG
jgi:hypothetical protein